VWVCGGFGVGGCDSGGGLGVGWEAVGERKGEVDVVPVEYASDVAQDFAEPFGGHEGTGSKILG
jgi:hypothetical protein